MVLSIAALALFGGVGVFMLAKEGEQGERAQPRKYFKSNEFTQPNFMSKNADMAWGIATRTLMTAHLHCGHTALADALRLRWNFIEAGRGDYIRGLVEKELAERRGMTIEDTPLDAAFCSPTGDYKTVFWDARSIIKQAEAAVDPAKYAGMRLEALARLNLESARLEVKLAQHQKAAQRTLSGPFEPDVRISDFCRNKWPNDYSMEEYCVKGQEKAKSEARGRTITDRIAQHCASKWPDNWEMFLYCAKQQDQARSRLGQ